MNELCGQYAGMDRFVCRKALVEQIKKEGNFVKIENIVHPVGHSERSSCVVEPMLSKQWFVKMRPLADQALANQKTDGKVDFVPKRFEKTFIQWMENVDDWCISRQLWWGHRIPAWYDEKGNVYVARNEEEARKLNNLGTDVKLRQDEDVLDTWFSSALWTFSTLGWPEQTRELKTFHPTNVLVTGFDIIFFWVARMIMMTMHFMKDENGNSQVPFKTVYVTGLIRDEEGQKMSKSKGNVLDPLDMIDGISLEELVTKRTGNMMQPQMAEKIAKRTRKQFADGIEAHGTDALRFTLAALASTGRDINWDMKRLEGYRNFCNKLWNASRYVLMNAENKTITRPDAKDLTLADRWILSRLQIAVKDLRSALDNYRFDQAASVLYEFIWNEFCDWYLELTKPVLWHGSDVNKNATIHTLLRVLETLLRLAHPIIPFITEEIWQNVAPLVVDNFKADSTIMLQDYPAYEENLVDSKVMSQLDFIKQLIINVRNIRAEVQVGPSVKLNALLKATEEDAATTSANIDFIKALANLESISVLAADAEKPLSITKLIGETELLIPMAGLIDKDAELQRLDKEIAKLVGECDRINKKLGNESFVAKAPANVIDKEKEKLAGYTAQLNKLKEQYQSIKNL